MNDETHLFYSKKETL